MVLHVIVITCDQFQGHKMANVSLKHKFPGLLKTDCKNYSLSRWHCSFVTLGLKSTKSTRNLEPMLYLF